jgi:hypothetical protein
MVRPCAGVRATIRASRGTPSPARPVSQSPLRHDVVLDISNVKRTGVAPRVGRVGLPDDAPAFAVNVDCSEYYVLLDSSKAVETADEPLGRPGAQTHSWYFGNAIFSRDVFDTIIGVENGQRSTRATGPDGKLHLARGKA